MPTGTEGFRELQEENEVVEQDTIETTDNTQADEAIDQNEQPAEEPQKPFDPKESTQETVKRALREEREKAARAEGQKTEEEAVDFGKPGRPTKEEKFDPNLIPPARFDVEEKELFTRLPRGVKVAVNKTIKNLEARASKVENEYRGKQSEYKDIDDVLAPHVADWNQRGFTKSQAISQLVATHAKLANPRTKLETAAWLLDNCGLTPEDIYTYKNGGGAQPKPQAPDISQHPEYLSLKNQVNRLSSIYDEQQQQSYAGVADHIVQEIEQVRNETDSAGRFKYPKLHEEQFLEASKPLVSALVRTTPGLSYGEAFKRAYLAMEGQQTGVSHNGANRVQAPPIPNQNIRAVQAATSVRGRSAPASSAQELDDLSPDEMKDSQSITRAIYNRLQNRR